jgi:hypothetical protein
VVREDKRGITSVGVRRRERALRRTRALSLGI